MKTIHLDLDGVLVDLSKAVFDATGWRWGDVSGEVMWQTLAKTHPEVFLHAPALPDANELVEGIVFFAERAGLDVEILTALPSFMHLPNAKQHKMDWVMNHFPQHRFKFKSSTSSSLKHEFAKVGDILIDDHTLNIRDWQAAGGHGIRHINAEETLARLHVVLFRHMKGQVA